MDVISLLLILVNIGIVFLMISLVVRFVRATEKIADRI